MGKLTLWQSEITFFITIKWMYYSTIVIYMVLNHISAEVMIYLCHGIFTFWELGSIKKKKTSTIIAEMSKVFIS